MTVGSYSFFVDLFKLFFQLQGRMRCLLNAASASQPRWILAAVGRLPSATPPVSALFMNPHTALSTQGNFQYHNANMRGRGGRPPYGGGGSVQYNEPTLIAKLLELFPEDKSWIPVSKWSSNLPEDLQEPLSRFGGLGKFTSSQSNFFIVRKENNINVVALTPMAFEMCREKTNIIKDREAKNAKQAMRRGGARGRGGNRGGGGRSGGNFGSGNRGRSGNFGSGRR